MSQSHPNILFVCLGNICRSPAAAGVLSSLVSKDPNVQISCDSCGIGDWHVGQLPDKRMRKASLDRGINLTSRARQFKIEDFEKFDYILAVDKEVLHHLYHYSKSSEHKSKIHLITTFSRTYEEEDIPDPYYGNRVDFDLVLDMLEDACLGLIDHIQRSESVE